MNIKANKTLLYSGTTNGRVSHTINGKFSDYDWLYFYAKSNGAQGWGHLLIPRTIFAQAIEEWLYIGRIGTEISDYYYCSVHYTDDSHFQGWQVSNNVTWHIEVYGISISR